LEVEPGIPDPVTLAQHVVVGRGDLHTEIPAVLHKLAQVVEHLAFGLGEGLHLLHVARVANEGPDEGGGELGGGALAAAQKPQEGGGQRRAEPAHVPDQPGRLDLARTADAAFFDEVVAQHGAQFAGGLIEFIAHGPFGLAAEPALATGGEQRNEVVAGQREGQRRQVELFFAGLVGPAVTDGQGERGFQVDPACAAFVDPVRAQKFLHGVVNGQAFQVHQIGALERKVGLHVGHQRTFFTDYGIGGAVGCLLVVGCTATGPQANQGCQRYCQPREAGPPGR
jgi:hypothetical protein